MEEVAGILADRAIVMGVTGGKVLVLVGGRFGFYAGQENGRYEGKMQMRWK